MSVFASTRRAQEDTVGSIGRPDALSILAPGLRVVGDLESQGVIKIEGQVEGSVRGSTQVLIAPGGAVTGPVAAAEVIVSGRVDGNVVATGRIEITAGGVVHGDVTAPRVAVHDGGEVNGRFLMERRAVVAPQVAERLRKTA